jgi:beta-glucosidase
MTSDSGLAERHAVKMPPYLGRLSLALPLILFAWGSVPDAFAQGSGGVGPPSCELLNGREDTTPPPTSFPWLDATLAVDQRVEALLGQMTLANKIDMATGEFCNLYGFFNAPVPRLKIPALSMADGPAGVRIAGSNPVNDGNATAMPAPIALAATWDVNLAKSYGDVLGDESFATGHNVLLGPAIDIVRTALGGRGFETFGEDPFLSSEIAVPYTQAIQAHPVLANAKHASLYNQETERLNDAHGLNVIVDERPMIEIYMPTFEAVIKRANIGTAMCAFNKVNGAYECEDAVSIDLLRNTFGLQGFIMSDYGATRSTVPSALAGLDQEQPAEHFYGQALSDAVSNGQVPQEILDGKMRHILRPMFEHKLFDQPVQIGTFDAQAHAAIARTVAEQSIVLLKNTDNALPLAAANLKSIAVIGGDAANASAQGGGSSKVKSAYGVTPLDGITTLVGSGVTVTHTEGTDPITAANQIPGGEHAVPSSVLEPAGGEAGAHGLQGSYYLNTDFSGTPAVTRVDRQVAVMMGFMNFGFAAQALPTLPSEFTVAPFSARWTGTLTVPVTGEYTFTLTSRGRATLLIGGSPVIPDTASHTLAPSSGTVQLNAGEKHNIQVDYVAEHETINTEGGTVGGEVLLSWTPPEGAVEPGIAAAAEAAKAADVAIVVVRDFEAEGRDRPSITLPNNQDQLIAEVAKANPRTIVVVQTGAPIAMPWLDNVPAVIEAWYGGQEQGNAIAAALFGSVNPSGKLPVSFPKSLEEAPASTPEQFPGVNGVVNYSEGIFVGYRWFDNENVEPLFPFGYGLSYTTFTYDGLQIDNPAPVDGQQQPVKVSFNVTNSGQRSGAELAQVYVGKLPGAVETPPRQLAGFTKVALDPGASQTVSVQINPRSLSYWDTDMGAWVTPPGTVPIYVGSSSRDVRLTGSAQIGVPAARSAN